MVKFPCTVIAHTAGIVKVIWVGKRLVPSPQVQVLSELKKGSANDDSLMNAAMMFNTLIRDGSSL